MLCWNDRYDTNRVSNAWVKPGVVPCSGEVFFLRSVDCGFIILIVFKGCFINYLLYIYCLFAFFIMTSVLCCSEVDGDHDGASSTGEVVLGAQPCVS